MIADRFAPIRLAEPGHPPQRHVATAILEPARAMPCYEGMDDTADYAQTLPRIREPLEGGLWLDIAEAA